MMATEEKWNYVGRGGRSSTTAPMTKPSWSLPAAERSKWGTPKGAATAAAPTPAPLSVKDKTAFPPLGGAKKASLTAKKHLDFRTAAEHGATAAAVREKDEREYEAYMALHAPTVATSAAHRARLSRIGNRSFDDGPEDYDGPEEDELLEDSEGAPAYEMDEAEAEAEFNAHLAVVRRSGDAGVW